MLPVDLVVELLELKQILVCRAERAHPVVLTDISEKHHGGSFVACSHSCLLILLASEFAEPSVALIQRSKDSDKATASLPFPLPTYATNVLLGGVCIFRAQRARPIKLLYISLIVLWR
jgi:hypothetical protein